ncbi:MAG: TRAP transporter substrate-binding protein DctP [Ideonella sp.]|nr:TRAP transporter substrate-binding protein DctP [Ideonella sp.]
MAIRRDLIKLGIAGAVLGAPAVLRAQQPYKTEYRMSIAPPSNVFAWGKGAERFAALARERTDGRIAIKPYWGASLIQGQQDREFAAMRQGIIDVLCSAPVNWSTTIKECAVFMLPFLFPDHRAYDAVITSEAMTRDFFALIRHAGAEPLAIGETGYRQISNSKHPIVRPADFKGLKIRVAGAPMFQDTLNALGANPASMPWADAYPALASGAVDGQENPIEVFIGAKLHTLGQKFVTKWNCTNDILLFAIANPVWQSWTPQDQEGVRSAARDAAREQIAIVRDLYRNDVEVVRGLGVQVHVPTPEEMDEWIRATRPPFARWKASLGADLVAKFEATVAQSRRS